MRFKRNLLKKKAVALGAVLLSIPFLFGFKAENGEEKLDDKSSLSAQTSDKTVDNPFTGKIDATEETVKVEKNPEANSAINEEPSVRVPHKIEYDQRMLRNEAEYKQYLDQFEGQTIVDVQFEGASESTLPFVKSAALMHAGDKFNTIAALRDIESIRNIGYFYDAYQTFSEIPEGVIITYHMMENPVVQDIVFTGNTVYNSEDINKMLEVKRGEVLNGNTLHNNITAIVEKYHDDGYIWMKIANLNVTEDGVINVKISEGVLEGYKVKGNTKTREVVILREMRQEPGEPFNANLARRSMERVYNLGFFEDVNIKMLPGMEPDAMIMEIDVEERRTGTFGVGAGYSTADGFIGSVSIADKNFLGMGDAVSISFEKSANERDAHGFVFSYRRPWLDKRETAANLQLYHPLYASIQRRRNYCKPSLERIFD